MNNLDAILEIAIGIVMAWLIISVAALEVQNIITAILNLKADFLEQSILDMFRGEQSLVEQFYAHPAIQVLHKTNLFGKKIKPAYIPNDAFAEVLLEMFIELGSEEDRTEQAIANLKAITQNEQLNYFIKRLLPDVDVQTAAIKARNMHTKAVTFKTNAENWFNTSMTKASSWYREKAKLIALIIGVFLAAIFNVDSIQIVEQLWREPTLRQSLVAQAQTMDETAGVTSVADLEARYEDLKLPVGWGDETRPDAWQGWALKVLGLFISGLAAMQGAPFWFDMLKKLLNLKDGSSSETNAEGSSNTTFPPSAPQAPPTEPEPVG